MIDVKIINFDWDEIYPIYFKESYLRGISSDYGWIGGYINNDLALIMPYVVKTRLIFKSATFQYSPISIRDEVTEKHERYFLNKSVEILAATSVDFITQPPAHAIFRICPNDSIATRFGSYILDLTNSEDSLWSRVHSKHRNVILNAQKKGVEIRFGSLNDISKIYGILVETMNRSKMSFMTFNEFKKNIESFGKNVTIFLACYHGQTIGCGIFPFSKYSCYYQYGGSVNSTVLGAMNLLHWEAIKFFKKNGVKRYDFVGARISPEAGSKYEGIQRFKERFGPQLQVGYLWKLPISYKYYIYKVYKKIKSNKNIDIIDQEIARLS